MRIRITEYQAVWEKTSGTIDVNPPEGLDEAELEDWLMDNQDQWRDQVWSETHSAVESIDTEFFFSKMEDMMQTCPECNRTFDLTNPTDANEFTYGHDCETT